MSISDNNHVFHSSEDTGPVGTLLDSAVSVEDARTHDTDHIMTWRKQGYEVPIFIQFNGYPPHVDETYQGRIRLVELTAIEISDLRAQDEGWYECSVVRLEGTDERTVNGSWIYLTINCTYIHVPTYVFTVNNRTLKTLKTGNSKGKKGKGRYSS